MFDGSNFQSLTTIADITCILILITEEFTYCGTIHAYKGIGLEMVGIPLDEDDLTESHRQLHAQKLQGGADHYCGTI
jgi:DNA-binding transcriptional MocR family regulator